MNWLNVLLGPVTEVFNRWRDRKHEIKVMKHDLEIAEVEGKIEVTKAKTLAMIEQSGKRLDADITWESLSIKNSGWKDEYLTLLMTLPFIGAFIPVVQDYVHLGFEYVDGMPFWYQIVLMVIVGAAFGVRAWGAFVKPLQMKRGA